MEQPGQLDVVGEFERAWAEPGHTRAVQPEIDVNRVLRERYTISEPLTFTRSMLWDVEERKAAAPGIYIPSVVCEGSDRSWGRRTLNGGAEQLDRHSQQRLWLDPDDDGRILERAHLDHNTQKVTFTGEQQLTDPDGNVLTTTDKQPRFHVEHAVGGTENAPLNLWRIVHLTDREDPRLLERFTRMWQSPWLPEFVEIYLRRDLHLELARNPLSGVVHG